MTIKTLFDPSKDIYRTIEKVITYKAAQETRLRDEIREYIVTDSIEDQLESLLTKMQAAMEDGGPHEVGVWVSGFYGSGKSSFTKYLALALDESVKVDGIRFLEHFSNRLNRTTTKAQLAAMARRFSAAVVMLDLASDMLAGAAMEDVATVLYYKVLEWAGYSRNMKVAALERRLQQDGRYAELLDLVRESYGVAWHEMQNDALAVDSLMPAIAHQLYPDLFPTESAFHTETGEIKQTLKDQVEEILAIVRRTSGRQYVLFVVDEVGQYVSDRKHLILNLQGLAENLKTIGDGKAWIVGTAQQTLTEDDPRAALNSPELYKLKDRFPIEIDLEAHDIKEICYKRLLGKSAHGSATLARLFANHGPALRHNTRLEDARAYDSDFNENSFANLYPFLPAHFDILLHLLGVLAKSTGGIGLRSAIKVIQDILVEGAGPNQLPAADRPTGWLATTVTLYDALEKDVRRAFPSIYQAVGKAQLRFPHQPLHQDVAKTVAVLQIMGNLPVTARNVAALLHPAVDAPTQADRVEAAIKELIADPLVPFGEKDNVLCFFSEKVNDIDQERAALSLRSLETRRIYNQALTAAFSPLPATRLQGTLLVTSGLVSAAGTSLVNLAGERETIQTVVELVAPEDFATARTRLLDESRQRTSQNTIYFLGRSDAEIDRLMGEIYRSREVAQRYRNELDQEVREYCTGQLDRANRLADELEHQIRRTLSQGTLIFRGDTTAADSLAPDAVAAVKSYLGGVAGQVFNRYAEASLRVDTAVAEKLLRLGNLKSVTAALDPLSLVQTNGGMALIDVEHKALVSIRDYLDRNGAVEGKRLTDHFSDAPFGWSPDTLRYLVAALLLAGLIRLKVGGRDITVAGQQAIDALRTNNSFKTVGVALRTGDRIPLDVLARAAERLTSLCGETVLPFPEDEISKAAIKHFPQFQYRYGPLAERLLALDLPGVEQVRSLTDELATLLLADASDAPRRLGSEPSPLHKSLMWAGEVDLALRNGLEKTVRELRGYRDAVAAAGASDELNHAAAAELAQAAERLAQANFYQHAADLNTLLTTIKARMREAIVRQQQALSELVRDEMEALAKIPDWKVLPQPEQNQALAAVEDELIEVAPGLVGLQQLVSQELAIRRVAGEQRKHAQARISEVLAQRKQDEEAARAIKDGKQKHTVQVHIPKTIAILAELDELIVRLQTLRQDIGPYDEIEITVTWEQEA